MNEQPRGNSSVWKSSIVWNLVLIAFFLAEVVLANRRYDKEMRQYAALRSQYDQVQKNYAALKAQYDAQCAPLKTEYDDLEKQYAEFRTHSCGTAKADTGR